MTFKTPVKDMTEIQLVSAMLECTVSSIQSLEDAITETIRLPDWYYGQRAENVRAFNLAFLELKERFKGISIPEDE